VAEPDRSIELPKLNLRAVEECPVEAHEIARAQAVESVDVRVAQIVRQRNRQSAVIVDVDGEETVGAIELPYCALKALRCLHDLTPPSHSDLCAVGGV
jgi:hypothetical protein